MSKPISKAHCCATDWVNKTINKKRIRQGSVILLYSEIHEDANDLIPFILKTKNDPKTKRLRNYSKDLSFVINFSITTSQQFAFNDIFVKMLITSAPITAKITVFVNRLCFQRGGIF